MTNIKFLQPGDLLKVIAPSGTLRELNNFEKGVEIWKSRGYRLELTPGFDDRWGYSAVPMKTASDSSQMPSMTRIVAVFSVFEAVSAALDFWKKEMWERRKTPNFHLPIPIRRNG